MEGFKKLTTEQKNQIKGGFAWLAFAQTVIAGIGIFRALFSEKGAITHKQLGSVSWDNKNKGVGNDNSKQYTQTIIYDY